MFRFFWSKGSLLSLLPKNFCRRSLVILFLILVIIGFGFLCLSVSYRLGNVFGKSRDEFFAKLEKEHGLSISYGRARLRFFQYYELKDFILRKGKHSIEIEIFRIHVSLWRLFFMSHLSISDFVRWVEIRNSDVHFFSNSKIKQLGDTSLVPFRKFFEFQKIKESIHILFDSFEKFSDRGNTLVNIRIEARRLNLHVETPSFGFKMRNTYFSFLPTMTGNSIKCDLVTELHLPERFMSWPSLRMTLSMNIDEEGQGGEAFMNFTPSTYGAVDDKIFFSNTLKFRAFWKDKTFEFSKVEDTLPFDVDIKLNIKERYFYFGFHVQNYNIGDYFDPNSQPISNQSSFWTNWDGKAEILYYPDDELLYYTVFGNFKTHYSRDTIVLDIDLVGNNLAMQIKKFGLSSSHFNIGYKGTWNMKNFFPSGELKFKKFFKKNRILELILNSQQIHNKVLVKTDKFIFDDVSIGNINIAVTNNYKNYNGELVYKIGKENLIIFRTHYLDAQRFLKWSLKSKNFRLLELVKAHVVPVIFTNFLLEIDVLGTLESGEIFVDAKRFDIIENEKKLFSSVFTLNNRIFRISKLALRWEKIFVNFVLSTKSRIPEFEGLVDIVNSEYQICGDYTKDSVRFFGNSGELIVKFSEKKFSLNLNNLILKNSDQKSGTHASISGRGSWDRGFNILVTQFLFVGDNFSFLCRDLEFGQNKGYVGSINYKDQYSKVTGYMGYQSYMRNGKWQLDGIIELSGKDGESYFLQVYYDEYWRGDIMMRGFPLERLNIGSLEGTTSTDITFTTQRNRPKIDMTALCDGFYKNLRLVLDVGCTIERKGVQLLGNRVQYGRWKLNGPVFLADFETGKLDFSSRITDVSENIKTGVSFIMRPEVYEGIFSFRRFFTTNYDFLIETENWTVNNRVFLPSYILELTRRDQVLQLKSHLEDLSFDFLYDLNTKNFSFDFEDKISLITAKLRGDLSPDEFYISVDSFSGSLMFFNPFLVLPTSDKRIVGFSKGSFFGNLFVDNKRLIQGDIKLNGHLKSPFSSGTIVKLEHQIIIRNSEMRLDSWNFHLHDKTFLNFDATLQMSNNFPYMVRVQVSGGRGGHFNFDILEYVKFNGRVLGWARCDGDLRGGYLSGRLEFPTGQGSLASLTKYISTKKSSLQNIIYKIPPEPYNFVSGSRVLSQYGENQKDFPLVRLVKRDDSKISDRDPLDYFTLVSGKDCTFYFPSKSFPTIQLTLSSGEFIDLYVDVTTPNIVKYAYLEGSLRIDRGEINYFGKKFLLEKEQSILFFNGRTHFNPYLDLKANYRTYSQVGRTIRMHLKNYALDTYDPKFSSEEGLSQGQIFSILGTNTSYKRKKRSTWISPSVLDRDLGSVHSFESQIDINESGDRAYNKFRTFEQIIRTGTAPFGGKVSRILEDLVRVIPFIDTVTIKTDLISNFALDRFYDSYRNEIDYRYFSVFRSPKGNNFAHYLDGTSINFGSYINKNVFFQTKVDLEKNLDLSRYIDSAHLNFNLNFNFQINTPFFLVDWSFNPMQNEKVGGTDLWKFKPEVKMSLSRTFTFRDWDDLYSQFTPRSRASK